MEKDQGGRHIFKFSPIGQERWFDGTIPPKSSVIHHGPFSNIDLLTFAVREFKVVRTDNPPDRNTTSPYFLITSCRI